MFVAPVLQPHKTGIKSLALCFKRLCLASLSL